MVQGKKQLNSKPKFAEVVIGNNEAKEMRESAKVRPADISIEQLRAYISITV